MANRLAIVASFLFLLGLLVAPPSSAQDPSTLSLEYYAKSCPKYQHVIRSEMESAIRDYPRNAAFILRLHFHDCFVQGCDGSVLLDDTPTLTGEKQAEQNVNSLKGFELVDKIKAKLEAECPSVVSCADLLAVAARDAVLLVGGPYWDVPVGRLDSLDASKEQANSNIPTPRQNLLTLIAKFWAKGLSVTDLVALVGGHTIGFARCVNFRDRIYGDFGVTSDFNPASEAFLAGLQRECPEHGGDDNVAGMDYYTPASFDNAYFETLVKGEGLLRSDQAMYSDVLAGVEAAKLVERYWTDPVAFAADFSVSMVKMGNLTNVKGGEVRKSCRFVNTPVH